MLKGVRLHVPPGSFPLLLGAATLLYVLNAIAIEATTGEVLELIAYAAVASAGLYFLSVNRPALVVGVLSVSVTFALRLPGAPLQPNTRHLLQDGVAAAFVGWLLIFAMREVFRRSNSERDAIVGALAGFLLLIFAFTRLHGIIESLAPGSYAFTGVAPNAQSNASMVAAFQYFSTITTTTVGFGDILPLSIAARLLTGIQAIVGQLYLAVVVATLVSRAAQARP
jgi:hypothetical protein